MAWQPPSSPLVTAWAQVQLLALWLSQARDAVHVGATVDGGVLEVSPAEPGDHLVEVQEGLDLAAEGADLVLVQRDVGVLPHAARGGGRLWDLRGATV